MNARPAWTFSYLEMPNISSLLPTVSLRSLKRLCKQPRKTPLGTSGCYFSESSPWPRDYSVNTLWCQRWRALFIKWNVTLRARAHKQTITIPWKYIVHHFTHYLFPLPLWHISYCYLYQREHAYARAVMFVFPGESSFAVCLDSVRKASAWPLCLSGLNCLITVIIWTGRKNHLAPWHHAGQGRRGLWKTRVVFVRVSRGCLVCDPQACDVFTLIFRIAHMHIQHTSTRMLSEFPTSPGHFAAIRWKSSMSEPRCSQRKVQGAVWLIHDSPGDLRPRSLRSAL